MRHQGLADPLAAARVCVMLENVLGQFGLKVTLSDDFRELNEIKLKTRGYPVAPMHDPNVTILDGGRAFWMMLSEIESNAVLGLQAYRCDHVDTNLADWCMNYMIGIYMRRQELMVPSHINPPLGSSSLRLCGDLVYHGECWVSQDVKNRRVMETFVRLGTVLSYIKWHPMAVWALVSAQVARNGFHVRAGYTTIEKGFLRWTWASEGIDPVEYLIALEKPSIEALIDELESTAVKY